MRPAMGAPTLTCPNDRRTRPVFPAALAPGALPAAALRGRLVRPREHRLRGPADECGPGVQRRGLRPGRRHLLRRLCAVRGAQQPHPGPRRRAPLDRADHGHLGRALGGHDVRRGQVELLRAALRAGRGRGGLPARHPLLPVALVPEGRTGAGGVVVHAGHSAVHGVRRAAGRRAAEARRLARPAGLAVAVRARRACRR